MTPRRLACLLLCLPALAAARAPAPSDACLDARDLQRVRAVDENTLLVAAGNGRFVVAHASGCAPDDSAALLAADGWLCGAPQEFVRSGDVLCPVRSVTRIDGRTYAGLAAAADRREFAGMREGDTALEPVVVTAPAARARTSFRGDTDYCFPAAAVRAWEVDGDGLLVHTARRRAGGNARYRVELAASCPELQWADNVEFQSGMAIGMICGHPGDRAVPRDDFAIPGTPERGPPQLGRTEQARATAAGCAIATVYPQD